MKWNLFPQILFGWQFTICYYKCCDFLLKSLNETWECFIFSHTLNFGKWFWYILAVIALYIWIDLETNLRGPICLVNLPSWSMIDGTRLRWQFLWKCLKLCQGTPVTEGFIVEFAPSMCFASTMLTLGFLYVLYWFWLNDVCAVTIC